MLNCHARHIEGEFSLRYGYIPVPNMHCYSSGKLAPFQSEGKGLHRPSCSSAHLALLYMRSYIVSKSSCLIIAVVRRTFTIVTLLLRRVSSVGSSSVASFIQVYISYVINELTDVCLHGLV